MFILLKGKFWAEWSDLRSTTQFTKLRENFGILLFLPADYQDFKKIEGGKIPLEQNRRDSLNAHV